MRRSNAPCEHMEMLREGLGPDIDFAVDFHARPSPTVAAIILREIEPLNLLFAEEICPPENVRAMAARGSQVHYSHRHRRASDRCYGFSEIDRSGHRRHASARYRARGRHHRAMEGVGRGRSGGNAHGAPRLRGPDRRNCESARRRGIAELAGAGNLRRRPGGRDAIGSGRNCSGLPPCEWSKGDTLFPPGRALGFEVSEAALKKYPFQGTRPFVTAFHEDGSLASHLSR